jgi:archaeal flagellar protein FlaJ
VGVLVAGLGVAVLMGRFEEVGSLSVRPTHGIDILAVGFLIGVGPYSYFGWREQVRLRSIDARLPDFLTDLASLHKAGLTLPDSLTTSSKSDYGPLTREVRESAEQVRWDIPILTVLEQLKNRIGTLLADRTLTVVIEAGKTGGKVPEVLEIAAQNARAVVNMRDNRERNMSLYVIITYVASLVFIAVCLALEGIFVPRMLEAFGKLGGGGALGFSTLPSADAFRSLFLTAALVQAIGNGMVGGVMSDGKMMSGLKHAWTMTILTLIGFQLTG